MSPGFDGEAADVANAAPVAPGRAGPGGRFPGGLPASGAWRPGDDGGDRRFATVSDGRPFALEWGGQLSEVRLAYETWGELDRRNSNAVLVCHALTGDSHAAGDSGPGHPSAGWWSELIGPGKAVDTDRYFVPPTSPPGHPPGL
ncbi:MAG: hypothetical protein OXC59_03535 [Acidimicrobiaceae bacterium]|nr:hypothetical protein [Acidimicrobiaceae bacterium]